MTTDAAAAMAQDYEKGGATLTGMPGRPGRDPRKKTPRTGAGSIGDTAFKDAVILVVVAWAILFFLAFSLRHHNV